MELTSTGIARHFISNVYAIGDRAAHHNNFVDENKVRLEYVQNANDQAKAAALAICGRPQAYNSVSWFWSNQYDLKLQTVGLSSHHDEVIIRGEINERSFSIIYLKESRVISFDCVNSVKGYVQGKALILSGERIAPKAVADPSGPLKGLLKE